MDTEKAAEIDTLLRKAIETYFPTKEKQVKDRFLTHFDVKTIPELKAKHYQDAKVLIASIGQQPQQKKA